MKGLGVVPSPMLDTSDIAASELYWVRTCQETFVQKEVLGKFEVAIWLFSDSAGVWRCRGRLENADLPVCTKHPIFLPAGHHITSLQVLDCHRQVMHGGVKETLIKVQMQFWIVKARIVMKKLLHQCTICTKFNERSYGALESPPMPLFHVEEYPPFLYVGVDYAGPLYNQGDGVKI